MSRSHSNYGRTSKNRCRLVPNGCLLDCRIFQRPPFFAAKHGRPCKCQGLYFVLALIGKTSIATYNQKAFCRIFLKPRLSPHTNTSLIKGSHFPVASTYSWSSNILKDISQTIPQSHFKKKDRDYRDGLVQNGGPCRDWWQRTSLRRRGGGAVSPMFQSVCCVVTLAGLIQMKRLQGFFA